VDEAAREDFRSYVVARSPALLRTAYLLTGSRADAEDLLQTALAKTYLAWDRIRDREALDGYVRRVMVNTQTSWWRRRRPEEYATDQLPERPVGDGSDDFASALTLHDALWTALAGLPKRQRAMVVLRYYEDLSEAETAAVMGVSVGTVKSTTSRALTKLRDTSGLRDDPRATLPTGAFS
jgi:RNA polymerase sigma-70 factor (sigma-E family)